MLPDLTILTEEIEEPSYSDRTYKVKLSELIGYTTDRIHGYTEGINAVKQSIYFILNTERYRFPIYSWDYGVELENLFGKPMPYVISEVARRIEEALLQDDRIIKVENFEFEPNKKNLHVTFNVATIYGDIEVEKDVFKSTETYASDLTR